jgi:hypothetical protein
MIKGSHRCVFLFSGCAFSMKSNFRSFDRSASAPRPIRDSLPSVRVLRRMAGRPWPQSPWGAQGGGSVTLGGRLILNWFTVSVGCSCPRLYGFFDASHIRRWCLIRGDIPLHTRSSFRAGNRGFLCEITSHKRSCDRGTRTNRFDVSGCFDQPLAKVKRYFGSVATRGNRVMYRLSVGWWR